MITSAFMRRAMGAAFSVVASLAVVLAVGAATALAVPGPHWTIIAIAQPTYFHPGDQHDYYEVIALNDGGAETAGKTTITDALPSGLTVSQAVGSVEQQGHVLGMPCTKGINTDGDATVTCETSTSVPVDHTIGVKIGLGVPAGASGELNNEATISGGGGASAADTIATPVMASAVTAPFGVSAVSDIVGADGGPDVEAGSHPYAYSTLLAYNSAGVKATESCGAELAEGKSMATPGCATSVASPKDTEVSLPPGLVGNPSAVPVCSQRDFQSSGYNACPAATQVGIVQVAFRGALALSEIVPVYNVEPSPGQPAELGFTVSTIGHTAMLFHVRRVAGAGGYGLTAAVPQVTEFLNVQAIAMTIWGVPADESHTPMRSSSAEGSECSGSSSLTGGCVSRAARKPFLTMPTSCSGAQLTFGFAADSWQEPLASPMPASAEDVLAAPGGCEALHFGEGAMQPSIEVQPADGRPGAPAGYGVGLSVPQNEEPEGHATPDVRTVEVAMPAGTTINASAANKLESCSMRNEGVERPEGEFGLNSETTGTCPPDSRIGSVAISSPLISQPLTGSVYVGEPECSPCTDQQIREGKMVRLLIEARLPEQPPLAERPSVLIKLAGHTRVDPTTGQLTTVFDESPQLPFDELQLALEGGPDAPLANPANCGSITASAHLVAWSGATSDITSQPATIDEGCSPPGFSPSFEAGMTTSERGGAFSGFAVTIDRPDGQQTLGQVTIHTPPGLEGIVSGVQLCGEPQANLGDCPDGSQIGTVTTVIGPGSEPYTVGGGKVFLTERYGSGSFGLSIVVPAQAGPFHLAGLTGAGTEGDGDVVVRGAISVDETTGALTISTDPLPTQLAGIPLNLDNVIVNIDRGGFMFNPTNCEAMAITGAVQSSAGTNANLSFPFQAHDCASLPFHPRFKVLVHAKHSRKHGVYAHFVIESGTGQANMRSVLVQLPKILPSRESTLKQACTEAQFDSDPSGCPSASKVGMATAYTPVLPVPLTGPAIFVSHGGAAYPDLDLVLQGDNVTVVVAGSTHIDGKTGVTSSDFKAVPDVPISRFDLVLPAQRNSALGANGNLCTRTVVKKKRVRARRHGKWVRITRKAHLEVKRKLTMPTTITGQNGAVIETTTDVAVSGCRARSHERHHRKKSH